MNVKFQTKLYFVFSCIIFLAISSFSLFFYLRIYKQIREETVENSRQLCVKITENVDTYVEKMDDITKKLISEPTLFQVLREVEEETESISDYDNLIRERKISDIISNAISLTSFPYVNVYIYSQNGKFAYAYNQNRSNFQKAIVDENNLEKLGRKKLVIYADNDEALKEKERSISFIRAIYDVSGNRYGYIEVQSNYKKLNEICDMNGRGNVILINQNGEIVFPVRPVSEESAYMIENSITEEKEGVFKCENQMNFYITSDYSGLITFIEYPSDVLYSSLWLLQRATVVFLIVLTLAAFLMMLFFSHMLVKPLHELRDSVLKITYEDVGLKLDDMYNDEIINLRDAFQKILNDLKASTQREIEANKAEVSARLSALQAQISPHFIHNVLYSISISAKEGRVDDASAMCKQLSDMLRYTVNSNVHRVELREEINCISNYLFLQKQYYEDFLSYEIILPKEAEEIGVPRLSILPFVENAIHHAFEGCKPPYHISVEVIILDRKWRIIVRDNGNGFPPDKIHEIQEKMQVHKMEIAVEDREEGASGMAGLGILNSLFRLDLFYEDGIEYEIKNNTPDKGTTIYLEGAVR